MSRPRTLAEPELGVSKFSRHLMSVLLPAPLGPKSPMVPGGTCKFTSRNACCLPYILPNPRASMMKFPVGRTGGSERSCGGSVDKRRRGAADHLHEAVTRSYNNLKHRLI